MDSIWAHTADFLLDMKIHWFYWLFLYRIFWIVQNGNVNIIYFNGYKVKQYNSRSILKRINMERLSQNVVKFFGDKKTDKITFTW
jgi:hypothetical protein